MSRSSRTADGTDRGGLREIPLLLYSLAQPGTGRGEPPTSSDRLGVGNVTNAHRGLAYCGATRPKGYHESLRTELLHEGSQVRVTMVQMPAANTPQFSWVLSRLPRRVQPVPPFYQPEVAA
jgi:hypothetical protein